MRKKQFIILIVVLVIVVVALLVVFLVNRANSKKEEAEKEAKTVYINDFDTDDVTAFSYLLDGEEVAFEFRDGEWVYTGDETFDIDEKKVDDFLDDMSRVTADSVVEDVEDVSEYGMDDPSTIFEVTLSDGSSLSDTFGAENTIVGGYYAQVADDGEVDDTTVYLVDSDVVTSTLAGDAESFQVSEDDEGSE